MNQRGRLLEDVGCPPGGQKFFEKNAYRDNTRREEKNERKRVLAKMGHSDYKWGRRGGRPLGTVTEKRPCRNNFR